MKVSLRVQKLLGIEGAHRELIVDVDMNGSQCKDAIFDLMNHDGEQAVFEWLKGAFPEWFEAAT